MAYGATYTFSIDNITQVSVIAQSRCQRITINENNQAGTGDLLIRKPTSTSPQVTHPAGAKIDFYPDKGEYFSIGQIVGYVISATGSFTMAQEEN